MYPTFKDPRLVPVSFSYSEPVAQKLIVSVDREELEFLTAREKWLQCLELAGATHDRGPIERALMVQREGMIR